MMNTLRTNCVGIRVMHRVLGLLLAAELAVGGLAAALATAQPARAAGILFVKPGGTSTTCTSWLDACELQQALSNAIANDEIWAVAGTYKPIAGLDRSASFQLKQGVAIYGGFSGTENARSQRNWRANTSILSGDIGTASDNTDNSYHVVIASGMDATAVLDGFTITAGNADGTYPDNRGGGIRVISGNPTLTNLVLLRNRATWGAGMSAEAANPNLANVVFAGNDALNQGGGLYSATNANPSLVNAVFSGNKASQGGGIYNDASSPNLVNVTFTSNVAAGSGGGLYLANGAGTTGSPSLANSIVWDNHAPAGAQITIDGSTLELSDALLQDACPTGTACTRVQSQDPLFLRSPSPGLDSTWGTADDDYGDLRLVLSSPAVDAGDNSRVPADRNDLDGDGDTVEVTPYDLAGAPRLRGSGPTPVIDLGAYEMGNTAPTLTGPADQATNEDTATSFIPFTIGDAETEVDGLVVTVTSENPLLVPQSGLLLSGTGANRFLAITPAAQMNGSAPILVSVSDGRLNTGQRFTLTVTPVNDAPGFTKGSDLVAPASGPALTIAGWASGITAGPPNESGQSLSFAVTGNSNPGLFSTGPAVSADGTLAFTPAPRAYGKAAITLVLKDNGGTANGGVDTSPAQSFTITLAPTIYLPVEFK